MSRSSLRPDLHRAQIALNAMPHGSAVTDRDGVRWQEDGWGFWHSERPEPIRSSFELAQLAPITPVVAEPGGIGEDSDV